MHTYAYKSTHRAATLSAGRDHGPIRREHGVVDAKGAVGGLVSVLQHFVLLVGRMQVGPAPDDACSHAGACMCGFVSAWVRIRAG